MGPQYPRYAAKEVPRHHEGCSSRICGTGRRQWLRRRGGGSATDTKTIWWRSKEARSEQRWGLDVQLHTNISQKSVAFEKADESEADEDSSSEEYDSDDPTAALIRETKREVAAESRKARDAKTQQSKDLPRARGPHQDSSLKGLSSLSGAGQSSGRSSGGPRDMSNVDCYKCGKKGHLKSDCPQARGSAGRGNGRGRR